MSEFQQIKLGIMGLAGLSKDALHVHVGLAVFLAVALAVKGGNRFLYAFLASLVVALAGEILDARDDLGYLGHIRWGASIHDIVNTTFWPAMLALLISRGLVGLSRRAG